MLDSFIVVSFTLVGLSVPVWMALNILWVCFVLFQVCLALIQDKSALFGFKLF